MKECNFKHSLPVGVFHVLKIIQMVPNRAKHKIHYSFIIIVNVQKPFAKTQQLPLFNPIKWSNTLKNTQRIV